MEILNLSDERQKKLEGFKSGISSCEKLLEEATASGNEKAKLRLTLQRLSLIKNYEKEIEKQNEEEASSFSYAQIEEARRGLDEDVRAFIKKYDIHFLTKLGVYCFHRPSEWTEVNNKVIFNPSCRYMVKKANLNAYNTNLETKSNNPYWTTFVRLLEEDGRVFEELTYSFAEVPPTSLNALSRNFLPRQEGQYHWIFDAILDSLSGGLQENKDHLISTIISAYLRPEESYLTPCQVFDDGGSTGKTLFASKVLTTIFGSDLVVPSVDIASLEKFNAHLAGKLFVFLNEVSQEPAHANTLKRLLGSPKFKVEFKGVDAMFVDNTANYWISGNNKGSGPVALSGGGVDRRYSIHCPKKKLSHYIEPYLNEKDEKAINLWVKQTGQHILGDPIECGKWINWAIETFGEEPDISPLHGHHYKYIADNQKPMAERVFDYIFNDRIHPKAAIPKDLSYPEKQRTSLLNDKAGVPNPYLFTYIRRKTLYDFYRSEDPSSRIKRTTFYKMADDYIREKGLPISTQTGVRWGDSSADVYINRQNTLRLTNSATPKDNDNNYYTKDMGRYIWHIELPS